MSITTQSPISLTILRRGDMLLVDVAELGSLIPRSETQVDDAFLQDLAAEVSQLATPGYGRKRDEPGDESLSGRAPERVVQDLQRIGGLIFSHLLTEPVRTRLRTAAPCEVYLRLDEQLIQAPWELGFDGESFLATKFRIGRQVITGYPLPAPRTTRLTPDTLKVLLIADPTQSLPQAQAEAEQLYAVLDRIAGVEVTLMGGKTIRKLPLLAALQEHEVVHFAGHSEYDPTAPHKSGWRLHEGLLTAAELSKLTRPPLLVFSNSCEAGTTAAWEGGYRYEGQAFGIGSAFLLAGVQNYIGTFWVVHDEESVGFAVTFYRSLAAGQTLGAALHEARQATLTQSKGQGLTWASYMLYGNPTMALLHGHNGQPLLELSSVEPQRVPPPGSALTQPQTEDRNEQPSVAAVPARLPRKLAAILSADVKGYSRLMGDDEEATIHTLKTYREVITQFIGQHHGRVIDSPGDNLLAEFASAVDAVKSAVAIQHELRTRNAALAAHRQMEFRIGLNVGDVIKDEGRLYGDGVNIAARLEALAEPGGICISGNVHEQVRNKLPLGYDYLGAREVKNIAEPVRVWRVVIDEAAAARAEHAVLQPPQPAPREAEPGVGAEHALPTRRWVRTTRRTWTVAAIVSLVLIAATFGTVRYFSFPPNTQPLAPSTQPALPLPAKPSIVVLPFVNMSKDPEQEYFSDGLTEVLTGDLSKLSSLFVIARNSAFTYKGKAVKVQEVGREMGVRYVLEGSVQKADQRVRITAQLIDASAGYHLWSEQYDRPLQDIFALQDEVVQKIVTTLKLQLSLSEQGVLARKTTDNLEAYDALLRGLGYLWRFTQEANVQARQLFERAIALDPQYAEAYAWVGWTYYVEWSMRWNADPQTLERMSEMAQKALALDDSLPLAHSHLGWLYAQKQQYEDAIAAGERAIALDPNNADSYGWQAEVLSIAGRPEEALRSAEKAIRLNPRYPAWYLFNLGWACQLTGRYTEAIAALKDLISRSPNPMAAYLNLAGSYLLQWIAQQSPAAQTLEPAMAAIQRALALSDSLHWNYIVLGSIHLFQQQYEQALAEMERAVALAPTEADSYAALAVVLSYIGRTEEALEAAAQALRLKPLVADFHLDSVGAAYATAGRLEEAIAPLQRYISRYPNILHAHLTLAAVYSELGKEAEAQAEAAEVLRLNPNFSLEVHKERMPIKDPAVLERGIAALRKAGLK